VWLIHTEHSGCSGQGKEVPLPEFLISMIVGGEHFPGHHAHARPGRAPGVLGRVFHGRVLGARSRGQRGRPGLQCGGCFVCTIRACSISGEQLQQTCRERLRGSPRRALRGKSMKCKKES
jgi:hypothetical protein